MAFKKPFVLSDESVNSYGFWVRTEGIRLEKAKKNCPCFFNHETWEIPLGHWTNFRVENGKLMADLVIEGKNEIEKEYIRKIENGDIKGASIGADPITWSEDILFLKVSQTAPTLYECELFEASITPLPGNENALALKNNNSVIALSGLSKPDFIPTLKNFDMQKIALKLGLPETATEAQILEAIGGLQLNANNAEAMRKHIEDQAKESLGSAEEQALFVELCKTNFTSAMSFLKLNKGNATGSGQEPVETGKPGGKVEKDIKVSDLLKKGSTSLTANPSASNEDKDSFDYLQKKNPVELARIRKEEPDKYLELAKGYQKGIRYTEK